MWLRQEYKKGSRKKIDFWPIKRENVSEFTETFSLFVLFVPKDDFFFIKSCFHINDALVGGAAEAQGDIFECFDVSSIYQNVDERKHFIGDLASWVASLFPKLTVKGKSRKTPNRFIGAFLAEAMQKRNKGSLVLRLKRLSAKEGQAIDIVRLAGYNDIILDLFCKGFTVSKIPRLGLKALLAMVCASRNKEDCAHTVPICNVVFL